MRAIEFKAPAERLSLNGRYHWRKRYELEQHWHQAAFVAARNAKVKDLPPSIVAVTFFVAQNRRRDPHNSVATVKPIVDGLVQAKVWPDDNSDWVAVVDPMFVIVRHRSPQDGTVRVELREMG